MEIYIYIYISNSIRRLLYDCYNALKHESQFADDVNAVPLVFPVKGHEDGGYGDHFTRSSDKTRPIPLSQLDSPTVSHTQSGGIPLRQITDTILYLEAKAIACMIKNLQDSGILASDQAAAFPSISIQFIFWVLGRIKMSRRMLRLLTKLYTA